MITIDFKKIGFIAKENGADGKMSALYIVQKMNDHCYKYPYVYVCKADLKSQTVSARMKVSMGSIMANLMPMNPEEDNFDFLERLLCQLPSVQQLNIISLYDPTARMDNCKAGEGKRDLP